MYLYYIRSSVFFQRRTVQQCSSYQLRTLYDNISNFIADGEIDAPKGVESVLSASNIQEIFIKYSDEFGALGVDLHQKEKMWACCVCPFPLNHKRGYGFIF